MKRNCLTCRWLENISGTDRYRCWHEPNVCDHAFVPPELYYNGQGKCYSESMIVEVPDENVPLELKKIIKGVGHSRVTNITILKEK